MKTTEINKKKLKVRKINFKFPWNFWGGGNINKKEFTGEEILYMTPEEWDAAEKDVLEGGEGYHLRLAE